MEAALVMSIVFFCLSALITQSYRISSEVRTQITLQEEVELLRHREGASLSEEWEKQMRSRLFPHKDEGKGIPFFNRIRMGKYDPEDFIRKVSLFRRRM